MSEDDSIDDVLDDDALRWTLLIECTECGLSGMMRSTGSPRDRYVWECEECREETVHEPIVGTREPVEAEQ